MMFSNFLKASIYIFLTIASRYMHTISQLARSESYKTVRETVSNDDNHFNNFCKEIYEYR